MHVSVVVPTYKRPESLYRCLDALARQDTQPDEILVVARREDEVSRQCISEREDEPVRLVPIDVPAGRPGFVAALNAGVAASRGEIVCLTDDDAEPHADWISRILVTFAADPRIGAVGGRDWVYHDGQLEDGAKLQVGTLSWWGRIIGNHHLGIGQPRDVAALKGVNLSVRGGLIRQLGFDKRLRGVTTEHHSEWGLCLRLLRMGYRIIYDPAIAVDHRPAPRVHEKREYGEREIRNAAHNETLALLEHLPAWRRAVYMAWTLAIGTSTTPGFAQSIRSFVGSGDARWSLLRAALTGRVLGAQTYLRSQRTARAHTENTGQGRLDAAGFGPANPVLTIGHSPSAAIRIEQLLGDAAEANQPPRGWRGMLVSARLILCSQTRTLYLVDVGMSTTFAAVLGRLTGKRVIVDTGDAAFALARSVGGRTFLRLVMVGIGEQVALRSAHEIVVRGRAHAEMVPRPSTHIPDLPPLGAQPALVNGLRAELKLEGAFVVGLVGSLNFAPRRRTSYGWDLIEALPATATEVVALIIGDGSGLEPLRQRAQELGVIERCRFVGRVPFDRVEEYVNAMDAAITTQTNDVVGRVRTTGKLPLYLACGCPVLASHVGEAAILLGPLGWTLPYNGVVDLDYPQRLAAAIERWRGDPDGAMDRRAAAVRLATEAFDLETMRRRLADVIAATSR
jgi:GT2 family glycosyltransferase